MVVHWRVGGGVRLRSRLSPGGGRDQKGHFKAITGTFFIESYKLGVYYIKAYKKMGIGAEITDFDGNLYFFQIAILL